MGKAAPVAFSLAFENPSIFRPWTISHLPPLHLTGNENMMSYRQHMAGVCNAHMCAMPNPTATVIPQSQLSLSNLNAYA